MMMLQLILHIIILSHAHCFSHSKDSSVIKGAMECTVDNVLRGSVQFCANLPATNKTKSMDICVWDFACDDLIISEIDSVLLSPHTLQVQLTDLGIGCFGEWNVTEYNSSMDSQTPLYEGEFSVQISNLTANASITFANYSNFFLLPQSLFFHDCSVPSANFEVHFLGGGVGKALDLTLAPKIEDSLEESVEEVLCGVGGAVSDGGSDLLMASNAHREDVIEAGQVEYPPPVVNGSFDWRTSRLASVHKLVGFLEGLTGSGGRSDIATCLLNNSAATHTPPFSGKTSVKNDVMDVLLDLAITFTGEVYVPLDPPLVVGRSNTTTLEVTALTISGLDSLSNFSLLVPSSLSGAVLVSSLGMAELTLMVNVRLNVTTSLEDGGLLQYSEDLLLTLDLSDVMLTIDLVVALSEDKLGDIFLDQFLSDPSCVLLALDQVAVSSLDIVATVNEISVTQLGGDATSLEGDVVRLLDNTMEWILMSWPVSELIQGLGQTVVREGVNASLEGWRKGVQESARESCPVHIEVSEVEYLQWNTSTRLSRLNALLNTAMGAEGVNNIVNCLTNNTGEMTIVGDTDANTTFTLTGLNSFYDFSILFPVSGQPYDLDNRVAVGYCVPDTNNECTPFGMLLQSQRLYVDLQMKNVELFVDLLFLLDKNSILNLNLLEVQTRGCVMSAAEALLIQASNLYLTDAELYIGDGESAPMNITHAMDVIIDYFEETGGVVDRVNALLAEVMDSAESRCDGTYDPSEGGPDGSPMNKPDQAEEWTWEIAAVVVSSFVAVVVSCSRCGTQPVSHTTAHSSVNSTDGNCLAEKLLSDSLHQQQESSGRNDTVDDVTKHNPTKEFAIAVLARLGCDLQTCSRYDAIFASDRVPLWLRIVFPVAIIGCIVTVTASNMLIIASVMVKVNIGDEITIEPDSLLDFSLGQTVKDMWHAEAYILALLISLFSGTWPYVKLLAMLVTWFSPSWAITPAWREWVLEWLDTLGKWSLLDCYIMVMMMVAFSVELQIGKSITASVTVVPLIGFNLFLLAILINLLLGHVAIYCHRLVTGKYMHTDHVNEGLPEAAKDHIYEWRHFQKAANWKEECSSSHSTSPSRLKGNRFRFTVFGKIIVTILIIGCMFLLIAGVFLLTFEFNFKGLVGLILGSSADVSYSVINTGTTVPAASGDPDSFIVRWIQVCFFGFGVVMPLFFLGIILVVWMIPMRIETLRWLVVVGEVANAWNAIDVFVISVMAALFEIEEFAAFMIGDVCDDLNEVLEQCCDEQLNGDDKCFDVTASLLPLFWVLGLAAGMLFFFGLAVLKVIQQVLVERQRQLTATLSEASEGDTNVDRNTPKCRDDEFTSAPALTSDMSPQQASNVTYLCGCVVNVCVAVRVIAIVDSRI